VSRRKLILAGGSGLILSLLSTAIALPARSWVEPAIPAFLKAPVITWAGFLFFLALALLEIPLMIYGLRKVMESQTGHTQLIMFLGNGLFVFFPVVYALPNLLVTDAALIWLGIIISATSLLRFTTSILFLAGHEVGR